MSMAHYGSLINTFMQTKKMAAYTEPKHSSGSASGMIVPHIIADPTPAPTHSHSPTPSPTLPPTAAPSPAIPTPRTPGPTPRATTPGPTPRATMKPHYQKRRTTLVPTMQPTPKPTRQPTAAPSQQPTASPSFSPTRVPTRPPSTVPPTLTPTASPTASQAPTPNPTIKAFKQATCLVSSWSDYGACSVTCGNGHMIRTRKITSGNWKCPATREVRMCVFQPCGIDVVVGAPTPVTAKPTPQGWGAVLTLAPTPPPSPAPTRPPTRFDGGEVASMGTLWKYLLSNSTVAPTPPSPQTSAAPSPEPKPTTPAPTRAPTVRFTVSPTPKKQQAKPHKQKTVLVWQGGVQVPLLFSQTSNPTPGPTPYPTALPSSSPTLAPTTTAAPTPSPTRTPTSLPTHSPTMAVTMKSHAEGIAFRLELGMKGIKFHCTDCGGHKKSFKHVIPTPEPTLPPSPPTPGPTPMATIVPHLVGQTAGPTPTPTNFLTHVPTQAPTKTPPV
jgi:hypothetical protein